MPPLCIRKKNFRYNWFENSTKISYLRELKHSEIDFLVILDRWSDECRLYQIQKGIDLGIRFFTYFQAQRDK